ncbi:MAG: Cna B-type domain-containing protein [Oscillospiraceae bacterium]|nr:Cna B-type domain-containing protein [Oscillospiraceae bacterium]
MKKKLIALLFAAALLLSLSATVFAADSVVTFKGETEGFVFGPGSGYTDSDLFDGLKNCMPGDTLYETVTVKNEASDSDKITLTLFAEATDLTYDEAFEAADGKDQAGVSGQRDETAATASDFLSVLQLRVLHEGNVIYEGSAACEGLGVALGDLYTGDSMQLELELTVPAELGNEYANRVGEVKWVFHAEAFDLIDVTAVKVWKLNGSTWHHDHVVANLYQDGVMVDSVSLNESNDWTYTWTELDARYEWTIDESNCPGFTDTYSVEGNTTTIYNTGGLIHTGQLVWPIPVLGIPGAALLFCGWLMLRREKQENA